MGIWRISIFILLIAVIAVLLSHAGAAGVSLDHRQIQSVTIFCALICGMLLYEDRRLLVAAAAVAGVLGLGLLSFQQVIVSANLDVILFILGTFLVAGHLEESFFFEDAASQIIRRVGPRPGVLIAVLMLAAMAASAVVGEVAAILFAGGAMMHIVQRYKLNAIPFLMMLVFATNTGSAASAFGPVAVTVALKTHLTVLDFFRWGTPIALAVLVLVFLLCRRIFARDWAALAAAMHEEHSSPSTPVPPLWRSSPGGWLLVAAMTALLVFHAQLESALYLAPNIMLVGAALGAGCVALLLSGSSAGRILTHRVDWRTLLFFMMLFLIVGALKVTGVTAVFAHQLWRQTAGHPAAMVLTVGWATGLLSALLDNMLAVAVFLQIVLDMKTAAAAPPPAVYWLMLFGATFMGNMTSIGSTSNIIACGMADKRGHGTIYFVPWLKIGLIISLASMALATVLLAIQTGWLTRG